MGPLTAEPVACERQLFVIHTVAQLKLNGWNTSQCSSRLERWNSNRLNHCGSGGEPPHRLCCGWKPRDAAPSSLTVSFPHSMHRLNTTLGTGQRNRTILLRATVWFTVTAEVSRNIPQVCNRFRLHASPPQHRARNRQEVTTRREQSQQHGGGRGLGCQALCYPTLFVWPHSF